MVGTLLLGGMTRADMARAKGEGTVAPRVAPPRIHVARLAEPAGVVVAEDAELTHAS